MAYSWGGSAVLGLEFFQCCCTNDSKDVQKKQMTVLYTTVSAHQLHLCCVVDAEHNSQPTSGLSWRLQYPLPMTDNVVEPTFNLVQGTFESQPLTHFSRINEQGHKIKSNLQLLLSRHQTI